MVARLKVTLAVVAIALAACSKSYRVGDHVLVDWEGPEPYPAVIRAIDSPGKYRVHFDNYDEIWDESVPLQRIRGKVTGAVKAPPPPPKVRARMSPGNKVTMSTFKPGDRVKVKWKGTYYPATILVVLGGETYRVHYDGYDANWDENVDISRIQRK